MVRARHEKASMPAKTHPPDLEVDPSSLLSRRPYALFLAGRFLGTLATGSQSVVIAWEVYELARRAMSLEKAAFAVGMIGLVQFLPLFALTLLAGETADRHDRRRILAVCYLAQLRDLDGAGRPAALGHGLWSSSPWPACPAVPGRSSSRRRAPSARCWYRSGCSRERSRPTRWPPSAPASSARPSAAGSAWRRLSWATRSAPGSTPPPRAAPC